MFKGLGNLSSLLRQAQEIGGRMKGLNQELRSRRATGSAGGGMVEVEVNGLLEVLGCRVDKQLVEQADCEMIEDLVTTAVNQAISIFLSKSNPTNYSSGMVTIFAIL